MDAVELKRFSPLVVSFASVSELGWDQLPVKEPLGAFSSECPLPSVRKLGFHHCLQRYQSSSAGM